MIDSHGVDLKDKQLLGSFEIVIVGGGIMGLSIASTLKRAGYEVALFEQGHFGGGATNSSLRIIHGGFRYLKTFNLGLVLKSLRAQNFFLRRFAGNVVPLPCITPLAPYGVRSFIPVSLAVNLYRTLLWLFRSRLPYPRVISKAEGITLAPLLKDHLKHGALLWYDALISDPQALVNEIVSEIRDLGGVLFSGTRVNEAQFKEVPRLNVKGAGVEGDFTAKILINATGISFIKEESERLTAFNIILPDRLVDKVAVGIESGESSAKRLFFLVPRDGHTVVGTGYAAKDLEGTVTSFVEELSSVLDLREIYDRGEVSIESASLPKGKDDSTPLLGDEILVESNLIEVISTKYTNAPITALKVLEIVRKMLGAV
jgi:glycerol-3-phosphate dehydrogenase